jgi:Arc/MetJ family transcription regulator
MARAGAGIETRINRCYIQCLRRKDNFVRTTLALDDALLAKAQAYTGLAEKTALVREALKALIERESARRLARLGGSEPDLKPIPRRRPAQA